MAYLTTFYWGWLLASLLLGLAMGWISVVQHGEGVSKNVKRWLAVLAAALVAAALVARRPRPVRLLARPRPHHVRALSRGLRGRIVAARLGGLAQRAGRVRSAMTLLAHYRMFGHYNAWANARLYDAAARLGDEQYRADRGAFFKSVHGTLNHLLATDRIWMQRFTGTGTAPDRLDAILFETLDELRTAREAEDRRIVDYVDGLDDARIAGSIRYRRVSTPEVFEQATGARSGPLVQSPDPPPRPGPRALDRLSARRRNSICCTTSGFGETAAG